MEDRRFFLDNLGPDEIQLKGELEALLQADECQQKRPLTDAIGAAVGGAIEDRRRRLVGSVVGRYQLTEVIGRGGVGTVYKGVQLDDESAHPVAIKVVEHAAIHADTKRRFQAERQILADLQHINIARMFDAGETAEGFPYMVMEFVQGEPIDRFCDRHRLAIEDRIHLFLQVCDALQYAHRNLVVHRDLKPANILVTAAGRIKLLDFGIAKLLDAETSSVLALTRLQDQILTPEYASPEQVLGHRLTTSSDVYSLGVLLYELLTGQRPYAVSTASRLAIERAICTTDPQKPSNRTRTSRNTNDEELNRNQVLHIHAGHRNTTPTRLRSRLRGDLDAIVSRAIRKKPEDRYVSVEQLGDDLRRHLILEPVLAHKGSWFYVAHRFVQRHTIAIAVLAVLFLVLALALVQVTYQSQVIAQERDNAERQRQASDAVTNYMISMFDKPGQNGESDPQIVLNEERRSLPDKTFDRDEKTSVSRTPPKMGINSAPN
jgi:serine/threonine protein kinase